MDRSIAIGGFMGVGKTTVGAGLAVRCSVDFVDLDREIEERCGLSVGEVFRERGEEVFRELEAECLHRVLQGPPVVMALGGGTLHFGLNCKWIQSSSQLFCLGLPLAEIRLRIGSEDAGRPLWQQAKRLYEERLPLYRSAGIYVDVSGKSVDEVVEHLYGVAACG